MINAWRNVATPHDEVLRGTIDQSSFAANLSMVAFGRKEAGEEYLDAERFFARTYLTKSMKELLERPIRCWPFSIWPSGRLHCRSFRVSARF